jgi:acetylornithine deacetylase/succinyl-diaminopimelate desuccinylase-like protein
VISKSVKASLSIRHVPDMDTAEVVAQFTEYVKRKFAEIGSANRIEVRLLHTGDWFVRSSIFIRSYFICVVHSLQLECF